MYACNLWIETGNKLKRDSCLSRNWPPWRTFWMEECEVWTGLSLLLYFSYFIQAPKYLSYMWIAHCTFSIFVSLIQIAPLHLAAESGNDVIVRFLLKEGASADTEDKKKVRLVTLYRMHFARFYGIFIHCTEYPTACSSQQGPPNNCGAPRRTWSRCAQQLSI